jgi:hypothetical protein
VQTIRPIPAIQRELPKAMMTVPVDVLSGMVHIVQPFMIGDAADMFARSVAAKDKEKTKPDENKAARPDDERAKSASSEPPSPSANGNGRTKPEGEPLANGSNKKEKSVGGPSANGGNGLAKPLPPWLAEIEAKMPRSSANAQNGHGKGRKKR